MNNKKNFEKIITEKRAKSSNERPKYGLRKLTVGVVSCLLGYMMFMTPNVVQAEKVEQPQVVAETVQSNETVETEQVAEDSEAETEVAAQSKAQAISKFSSVAKESAVQERSATTNETTAETIEGTQEKNDLEEKGDKERDKAEPVANPLDFGLKKDGSIEEKKAEEAIANKAELKEAASYEWVKKPELGDTEAHVKVTYKDGSYDVVTVAITTPKRPEDREGSNIITKGGNSFKDAIDASTDKTSKSKQTLAGFAWIENEPDFGSRDKGDVPAAGKKVYAQWKDGNGVVSPIFSTVVREDGSFVFDLSRPVKNADGSFTEFKLAGDPNFSVKMWAEEMEGYSIVKNGDMYSNYITRTYRSATAWNFTAGINYIDNAQIQYQRKPNVEVN